MKRFDSALLLLLTGLLAACGEAKAPAPTVAKVDSIATINGKPITRTEFDLYYANIQRQAQANGSALSPDDRARYLDRFIGMHLAAQAGEKSGIDKQQKVADELSSARVKVLSEAVLQKYLDEHPVKEEELKPAYEAGIAKLPPQYHTRHILVDNPGTASELIQKIKGGANFAKLATKQSLDSSKDAGGDIGWKVAQDLPPEYAAAVATLKTGEMTPEPVKTQFGWHVIRLEEIRAQEVAPFEEVKDKVLLYLKQERLNSYLETLRKEGKVEMEQRGPTTQS